MDEAAPTRTDDRAVTTGEVAPASGEVPASTGGVVDLDRIIGRIPVVLVFLDPPDDPRSVEVLRSIGAHLADFGRDRIQVLAVAHAGADAAGAAAGQASGNARMLADPDGLLAERYGAQYRPGRPATILLDARGRLAASWIDHAGGTFAEELLERIELLGA
jgi:peroxiredoxin